MKYYYIRAVEASSIGEACDKVIEGDLLRAWVVSGIRVKVC